ncbi:hypothetical protein DdX_20017 [Ditylenchus destructor]|uniref:Uncharacterized protein n=1 Tax=Ditylenchus destructor TaxID=166010 RepID=A0AAD4MLJ8_9BILA|nr:hypothetical protein DdX_20017 [Ditylenchus destructor]
MLFRAINLPQPSRYVPRCLDGRFISRDLSISQGRVITMVAENFNGLTNPLGTIIYLGSARGRKRRRKAMGNSPLPRFISFFLWQSLEPMIHAARIEDIRSNAMAKT